MRARYYDAGIGSFTQEDTHWNVSNMIYGDAPNGENPLPNMNAILQSGNLYVYVMNNPTRYRDFTGNAAIYMNPYMSPDYTFTFAMRETNFWCYNQKYTFTGYIGNQRTGNASKIKFGLYDSSFNGCGWIAVYNTLLNLGGYSHPANIVHELKSGALLYGTLGVSPLTVRDYFRNRGYRSVLCINDFDSNAKSGNASILMYAHSEGTHYIAMQWDGNQYRAYNVFKDKYGVETFNSVEGFLKEHNYKGIAVIVVNYQ